MKLATYNIHYAVGHDGRADITRIAEAVRGADVIALQEVERNYGPGEPPDQPAALEALLPEYYWVYAPVFDVDASEAAADGRVLNRRRQHGVMLLSKTPIASCRSLALPKRVFVDKFNMQMGALEGVIDGPLGPLRVYVVHLGHLDSSERQLQVERLLAMVRAAPDEGGAWTGLGVHSDRDWSAGAPAPPMPENAVLLGDFNMPPESPEYAHLTSERSADGAPAFLDAWLAAGNGHDPGFTFIYPPERPDMRDKRIDYCFTCPALAAKVRACRVDASAEGSDHQPVWTEFAP
jgi:endonuclease/exonuclease/phosphatase family metal-dependent hydrolase